MNWLVAIAVATQVVAMGLTARRRALLENRTGALAALALGLGLTFASGALLNDVFAAGELQAADAKTGYASLLAAFAFLVVAVAPLRFVRQQDDTREEAPAASAPGPDDSLRGVVHDLRNLLTLVHGSASLLRMEASARPPVGELLTNIESASQRAAGLLDQLDGARRGGADADAECDAAKLTREMRELLAVAVPSGVDVVIDVDATPVHVRCDSVEFTRVLLNLVVNAGEAIGRRGGLVSVSVSIRDVEDAWRASANPRGALPAGPAALLRIHDDGPGVPEPIIDTLFEPDVSTKEGDRGIGLSIVFEIVRRRGGAIRVFNGEQRGAVFEIALPLAGSRSAMAPRLVPSSLLGRVSAAANGHASAAGALEHRRR